jgi:hypothetical protein
LIFVPGQPANIQYTWPHSSRRYLYVVSSDGGPGVPGDKHFANAFAIDPATGDLRPHGEPAALPSRPIHATRSLWRGNTMSKSERRSNSGAEWSPCSDARVGNSHIAQECRLEAARTGPGDRGKEARSGSMTIC